MRPSERPPPPPAPQAPAAPPTEVAWQRLHPIAPVIDSIDAAWRAWPLALFVVVSVGRWAAAGALIGLVAVLLIRGVVVYLRFGYRLDGTDLTVRSGVFVRRTRTLPADRVQQVSVKEKLRHRVFGVASVSIESAGTSREPEVVLNAVTIAEAERIRARLQGARRAAGSAPPPPDIELYRQPNAALIRWAVVNSPLVVLGVVGTGALFVRDWFGSQVASSAPESSAGRAAVFVAMAVVALMVAVGISIVRYYDTRLVRSDEELRLRYGLLTQHQVDVPRHRVQVITEVQTLPSRLAGVVGIHAHNASGTSDGTDAALQAVPRPDRDLLIGLLAPGLDLRAELSRHPVAALRRAVVRRTVPVVVLTGAVVGLTGDIRFLALLAVLVPAGLAGWRAWCVLGHGETGDVVVGRAGVWAERSSFVRRDRVQSVSVSATYFQRRVGLASVRVDVAQPLGQVSINDMAAASAHQLAAALMAPGRDTRLGSPDFPTALG